MKKTPKAICLLLAIVLACVLASCSGTSAQITSLSTPQATTPLALGANPFNFNIEVAGSVFSLPCPVQQFISEGFTMRAIERQILESGEYADIAFEKDTKLITLRVANPSETAQNLGQCVVTGLFFYGGEYVPTVVLSGGVTLYSQRSDALAIYGAPTGGENELNASTIKYAPTKQAHITFMFDDDDLLTSFEVFCLAKPVTSLEHIALPAEVNAYTPPAALSPNWRDATAIYGGTLYHIPAPVASFLQNGWLLRDEGTVAAGGWVSGISLQKGGQVLRTVLYNFSSTAQPLESCFVGMIESSRSATNVPVLLSGDISLECTYEEITAAYGQPDEEFTYDGTIHCIYHNGENSRLIFYFSNDDMALYDIELWGTAL